MKKMTIFMDIPWRQHSLFFQILQLFFSDETDGYL